MMHPSRQAYVEEVEPEVSPSPSNSAHRRYSYGYSRVGGMPVFFIQKTRAGMLSGIPADGWAEVIGYGDGVGSR